MSALSYRRALAVAVVALMVLSAGAALTAASAVGSTASHVPSGSGSVTTPSATAAGSTDESSRAAAVLNEVRESGRPAPDLHLPDFSVPAPYKGETVHPTYAEAPAPMGVADLGLTNESGTLVGSILDTSSVEGTITFTNALSVNVDGDGPDMFGVQLNAVVTGVTLFGNDTNDFWTQNFVSYTPSSGELVFGDNVWNFSNYDAYLSPNVFYANGPNGTLYAPVYYYAIGPTFTIQYPFTLTLYENSTVLFDRPAVFFNYTVSNSTMSTSGSFDYIVFNATAGTPSGPYPAGAYQINGVEVDPVGLPNDLELDVLGNDDGDTTSFYAMDATASIATWDSTRGAYVPVPTAMDAGSETGETSDGVAVSFSGSTPVADLTLGPSFLHGLWGMTSASGSQTVVQTLHPAPFFIFVNPGTADDAETAQWVPSSPTGTTTFSVPNGGEYWIEYLLADHAPGGILLDAAANSTTTTTYTGAVDEALGVYTPLIAFGNGELASLSSGGTGTLGNPYRLYDNQVGSIDPEFAAFNDYQFPVFPGLLLIGTTDHVSITPPSFEIDYPSWMQPTLEAFGLPTTNDLQIQLWDASNVRIVGGTISGWLSAFLIGFPEGSVMLWNSTDILVDGATFLDQGDAIVAYGGSGNTIWGNLFVTGTVGATDPADVLNSGAFTQGINESESGDLIYNNYFDVPIPAVTPAWDPLSCQIECNPAVYNDSWNVSLEPASAAATVFGETLTGSIIGTWYQGGNYWSNYGNQSNPYGVLPYNDSGWILSGGDYVPLVPFTLYSATFLETGLPAGATWGVSVLVTQTSNESSFNVSLPNGTYEYSIVSPAGYTAPNGGTFEVNGSNVDVVVTFSPAQNLTFTEIGLAAGLNWSVEVNGSTLGPGGPENISAPAGTPIVFAVAAGLYNWSVSSPGYTPLPTDGSSTVTDSAVFVNVSFLSAPAVTFSETGLPPDTTWTVFFTQGNATTEFASNEPTLAVPGAIATPGPFSWSVLAAGFAASPDSGVGTIPANATVNVTFSVATGLLSGTISPASASLYIGGGLTPLGSDGSFQLVLAVGVHSVEVTASGYLPYFNNVTVTASGSTFLSVNLTASPSPAAGAAGISDLGWALIGFLAFLAALFLVMTLIFAGRRRQPPAGMTPYEAPTSSGGASSAGASPAAPSSPPTPVEPTGPSSPAPAPVEAPPAGPPASPPPYVESPPGPGPEPSPVEPTSDSAEPETNPGD